MSRYRDPRTQEPELQPSGAVQPTRNMMPRSFVLSSHLIVKSEFILWKSGWGMLAHAVKWRHLNFEISALELCTSDQMSCSSSMALSFTSHSSKLLHVAQKKVSLT